MRRSMNAATLLASAFAFTAPAVAMEQELFMLELAVESALTDVGVRDVDIMRLSHAQVSIIREIVESDDNEATKQRRIGAVLAR